MASGNEREGIQCALNERYERFRAEARIPEELAQRFSAPLCLHVFPEWITSQHRVLVVAQETLHFSEWVRLPSAVEEALLSATDRVEHRTRSLQRGFTLQPRAIIFLTGPNYDADLLAEFSGSLEPFRIDYRPRELAKLQHPSGMPRKSVRTYHPGYLRRSRRWHFLQEIAGWIRSG